MNVIDRLSSSLGDSDNAANISVAEDIVKTKDASAIRELVEHLHDKNKRLQSDCIKTLYEIGEREPKLIAKYTDDFAELLCDKNQRLVWGAMTALDGCASANPEGVFAWLSEILKAADGESVIARDHAVSILAKLTKGKHAAKCFPILLDMVKTSPVNQLPSYAEKAAEVVPPNAKSSLAKLIEKRMIDVKKHPAKQKRLEKVLKRLA